MSKTTNTRTARLGTQPKVSQTPKTSSTKRATIRATSRPAVRSASRNSRSSSIGSARSVRSTRSTKSILKQAVKRLKAPAFHKSRPSLTRKSKARGGEHSRHRKDIPAFRPSSTQNRGGKFHANGNVATFKHRELYTTLVGTADWAASLKSVLVTPSNPALFPWMAPFTRNYETYKFKSLSLEYVPLTSTGTTGCIHMFMDENTTDPAPPTESAMCENFGVITCSANGSGDTRFVHCSPSKNMLDRQKTYFLGIPDADANPFDYYTGKFWYSFFGDAVMYGQLFVSYEVELYTPEGQTSGSTIGAASAAYLFSGIQASDVPVLGPS